MSKPTLKSSSTGKSKLLLKKVTIRELTPSPGKAVKGGLAGTTSKGCWGK
jgi:hypothetical protein